MDMFSEECILRVRGHATDERNEYGNPIIAPGHDEPSPCWYEPMGATEDMVAKGQQTSGYWLYLPLSAPIGAVDAVVLAGLAYQVIGEPARQPKGFIVQGYMKLQLQRVTG
ncbi:hypothetical protein AAFM46_10990 [Arthrobacter sp. TMP15]|uniref:hypothetical protein n=1 Tax=Arthrobacter sp. TMP15 TaxID=3140789 RepID=UPI0031BAFEEE